MLRGSGSEHESAASKGIELQKRDSYQGMALAVPTKTAEETRLQALGKNQRLKPEVVGAEYGMTEVMP